jgi:dihydroorotate dehydrogenase (NAD+) catalytic subunit
VIDLRTTLGPLALTSPLVAAAGTVGSVVEFADTIDFALYGAAVAKSVSPEPWVGRPAPRIGAIGSGMLNGIGIQNPGIDEWLVEMRDVVHGMATPVWPSIVAHDAEGFADVAARLTVVRPDAIEINLSCPNLDGVPFALDPVLSHDVVTAVRSATSTPLGAKLSPDARPVSAVAEAVVDAGADWVVMGNTVMGAGIDVTTRRPIISGLVGGYSGEPIRPITMRCVLEIRRHLPELPILACGGVSTADHAIEYLLAGADAIGLGSVHFARPRAAKRIIAGIVRYMEREGFADISSLKGAFRPWI